VTGIPRIIDALARAAGSALDRLSMKLGGEGVVTGRLVLTICITEDEVDGGFIAECVELPGAMSQGETREEALRNIVSAVSDVLQVRMERYVSDYSLTVDDVKIAPQNTRTSAVEIPVP
jgi:predicted RNase H-like HicB family nuclease